MDIKSSNQIQHSDKHEVISVFNKTSYRTTSQLFKAESFLFIIVQAAMKFDSRLSSAVALVRVQSVWKIKVLIQNCHDFTRFCDETILKSSIDISPYPLVIILVTLNVTIKYIRISNLYSPWREYRLAGTVMSRHLRSYIGWYNVASLHLKKCHNGNLHYQSSL